MKRQGSGFLTTSEGLLVCENLLKEKLVWFDKLVEDVKSACPRPDILRHFLENRERIIYTIEFLKKSGIRGKSVCEMGAGGIALACKQELKADVDVYDCSEWFKPVYDKFSIPWNFLNLNDPSSFINLKHSYDIILVCEVIAHIGYWPVNILTQFKSALKQGAMLVITTQNLHRLSNRIRMLVGKRIFANFVPEELIMAHLREYTPEEVAFLLQRAGFPEVHWKLIAFSDTNKARFINLSYKFLCRILPRLSNIVFLWASKTEVEE